MGGGLGEGGGGELLNGFLLTFKSIRWLDFKGVSRIFSRRSGFKKKFLGLFFRSTKLIFRVLPKHYKIPVLAKNSVPQAKFEKSRPKKAFLGTFSKMLTEKKSFFGARSPLILVYIGAQGAFRKISGSLSQIWISQNSSKVGPFGSAGGGILEEERRPSPF